MENFGEEITEDVSPTAAWNLLMINENSEKLLKEKSEKFHSVTANLLYIINKGSPDL